MGGHESGTGGYEIIRDVTMTLGARLIGNVAVLAMARAHLACSLGGGQALE